MIYTITLNPSIDYFIEISGPMMDTEVNRADYEKFKGGGKGINVSMVLNALRMKSVAIALLGGFTGDYIQDYLKSKEDITLRAIPVEGMNRINVKIHNDHKTLCINGNGPKATHQTETKLLEALKTIQPGDWVILSGSRSQNISYELLIQIANRIHALQAKLVIDMESLSMTMLKDLKPYLIKPNRYELSLLVQQDVTDANQLVLIDRVLRGGAENVLLSLGADGAVFKNQKECYKLHHDTVEAVNKVGSGDAMLAGFVGKLSDNESIANALKWAGACGNAAASTFEDIDQALILNYLKQMKVIKQSL